MDALTMFHTPAHKYVGPNPPAQRLTFISRTVSGRPRCEVSYIPVCVVICGHRYDLAVHASENKAQPWHVSDPLSGYVVVRLTTCKGDLREHAANQVRAWALTLGEEEFRQRIDEARQRVRTYERISA